MAVASKNALFAHLFFFTVEVLDREIKAA